MEVLLQKDEINPSTSLDDAVSVIVEDGVAEVGMLSGLLEIGTPVVPNPIPVDTGEDSFRLDDRGD